MTQTHYLNIYLMIIFWSIDEYEVDSEGTKKMQRKSKSFRAEKS
jgi:hypothetical protein